LIGRDGFDVEQIAQDIVSKGMNVREVEALFSTKQGSEKGGATSSRSAPMTLKKDADTKAAEREMSDALGLAIEINPGSGEAGEIIIRYRSLEQFEAVRHKLTN
jgi:ParB family chromosome partitioning protein